MTDDEARKLLPGDVALASVSDRVETVVVSEVDVHRTAGGHVWAVNVWVRRDGSDSGGRPFPVILRRSRDLTRLPNPDAPTANVIADWLDEHDEPMAAHKLRLAFPLGGEAGVPAAGAGGG